MAELSPETFLKIRNQIDNVLASGVSKSSERLSKEELENQKREIENSGLRQDIQERKKYAVHIFWMVALWLLAMVVIIFYKGFGWFHNNISDAILLALIGSTTLNVLTFFVIVTKYLFPNKYGEAKTD